MKNHTLAFAATILFSGSVVVACGNNADTGSSYATTGTGGHKATTTGAGSGTTAGTAGSTTTGGGGMTSTTTTTSGGGMGGGTTTTTSTSGTSTSGSASCVPMCNIDADCQGTCGSAPGGSIYCCSSSVCFLSNTPTCPGGGTTTSTTSSGYGMCNSPDTPIATPSGERRIADLRVGDLVYSVERDGVVAVPVLRATRTAVWNHHVVRIQLATGRVLEISPNHPTADGRTLGQLHAGDTLDGQVVASVERIAYESPFTYDILPASSSHAYYAGGALIGTTLAP